MSRSAWRRDACCGLSLTVRPAEPKYSPFPTVPLCVFYWGAAVKKRRQLGHEADVIVLACALNADTRGFADDAFFATVKSGAVLVNVARGGLVDDTAMIAALDRKQVSTAILDVFQEEPLPAASPLWTHPNVRMTPHTSFAGSGVRSRWDALFLDNIARFVRGVYRAVAMMAATKSLAGRTGVGNGAFLCIALRGQLRISAV